MASSSTQPADSFVSDGYGNCRVHKFAPGGRYLYSWGRPGKVAPGDFHIPHGIAVHADGRVFVCDRQNNRVQIFTPEGYFITQWTDLKRPSDICIDEDQAAYVTEQNAFLTILDLDGRIIEKIEPGPSYNIGHAICSDSHGDLYIGQNMENYRLLKLVRQS
jgi:sugar lactone lactonase YvrE